MVTDYDGADLDGADSVGADLDGADYSDTIDIPNTEVNMMLVNSLIDNGWDGYWREKGNKIVIGVEDKTQTIRSRINGRPFEYYEAQRLAACLAVQLEQLVNIKKSFLFFDLDDITIIDDQWYIINCYDKSDKSDKIVDIVMDDEDKVNNVEFWKPVRLKGDFMAPEIQSFFQTREGERELPFYTNVSCIYYSIALLIMEVLHISDTVPVAGSPMFFFLERCLEKNPDNRFFLFV